MESLCGENGVTHVLTRESVDPCHTNELVGKILDETLTFADGLTALDDGYIDMINQSKKIAFILNILYRLAMIYKLLLSITLCLEVIFSYNSSMLT